MLPACRLGDQCTGHGAWPPREATEGSENVLINDLPAHRLTDAWADHCMLAVICHSGALSSGCENIFINDLPAGRMTDDIDCGSTVAEGSDNVFSGM